MKSCFARVAQWIEHWSSEPGVAGSNPASRQGIVSSRRSGLGPARQRESPRVSCLYPLDRQRTHSGHLTDTNATFLAQELNAIGAELLHVVQCSDHRGRLTAQIVRALNEADLVICTGGIGPTEDDLTREAIADAVGESPSISEPLLEEIRAFFAIRGMTMPERNGKQAWTIPSSDVLPNPIGTAPGWFVFKDGKAIVAMPGVPREMKRMWLEQALPRVNERLSGETYSSITIKTIGIGESALEDSIQDLVAVRTMVATYAKDDGVQVRVTELLTISTKLSDCAMPLFRPFRTPGRVHLRV